MRLLHVSDCFAPAAGGLERHVRVLAHANAERCEHVAVATLTPGPEIDSSGGHNLKVWRLSGWSSRLRFEDPAHRFHPTVPDPGAIHALRHVIEQERPDVVHAHGWIVYSAAAILQGRPIGLVFTLHDHGLICAKRTLTRDGRDCPGPRLGDCLRCAGQSYGWIRGGPLALGVFASRPLLRRVDQFIAISRHVARASAWATKGAPVSVIPPAIDFSPSERLTHPKFLPKEDYILFVGALGPHKGVDVLLAAHRRLERPPKLVLLGQHRSDTPELPPDVIAPGQVDGAVVRYALDHCRLAVAPSTCQEAFGAVVPEAMRAGAPIIVTRTGGLQEIVEHERTGLLVAPGSAEELAGAMQRLLDDRELSRRLAAAARVESHRYGAAKTAAAAYAVYREAKLKRPRA
jgi:glycosyltransferase involved in cell wall biosynthesis